MLGVAGLPIPTARGRREREAASTAAVRASASTSYALRVAGYSLQTGPRNRSLRVSDQDRESVGEILREQHVAGRIDAEEFQERLDQALVAKTHAQLDALIADLPSREDLRRRRAVPWIPFALAPLCGLAIVAVALGGAHIGWVAFPIFFFVLRPLLWRRRVWR